MKRILLLAGLLLAACAPKSDMDKYIDSLMGKMTYFTPEFLKELGDQVKLPLR